MSAALLAEPVPRTAARGGGLRVEVSGDWPAASAAWARVAGPGTAFQDPRWLDAWYEAHRGRADIEPLAVAVEAGGRPALLLPLVRRRSSGVRVVEFADLGLTDYNLPLLGPAAPGNAAEAARLWRAVARALRGDLVRLRKMPPTIGERPNPLALLPGAAPCALGGNLVVTGDSYADHMRGGIPRPVRMELERSWRVFGRRSGARFRQVTGPAEGLALLEAMDRQQRRRMEAIGRDFDLDRAQAAVFYRRLVGAHLVEGYAVMAALEGGDGEVVAAMLGVRSGETLVVVRLSHAGDGPWSSCSPGRLVLERGMNLLHGQGCRRFDFGTGSYDYKRRLGARATPLVDVVQALTPLGLPGLARARGAAFLRRRPALDARARRLLGLRPPESP